jgi:hypothetical protein
MKAAPAGRGEGERDAEGTTTGAAGIGLGEESSGPSKAMARRAYLWLAW